MMTEGEQGAILARARKRVDDAFAFARESVYPEAQAALDDVFV